jgi:hypothetical protein
MPHLALARLYWHRQQWAQAAYQWQQAQLLDFKGVTLPYQALFSPASNRQFRSGLATTPLL